jgi:hypothetical protein
MSSVIKISCSLTFLALAYFGSLQDHNFLRPPFSPPFPVSKLSLFLSLAVFRRSSLLTGEESNEYYYEKAWPSINRSILSTVCKGSCLARVLKRKPRSMSRISSLLQSSAPSTFQLTQAECPTFNSLRLTLLILEACLC